MAGFGRRKEFKPVLKPEFMIIIYFGRGHENPLAYYTYKVGIIIVQCAYNL